MIRMDAENAAPAMLQPPTTPSFGGVARFIAQSMLPDMASKLIAQSAFADDEYRAARQRHVDDLIEASRAITPIEVINRRSTDRRTIREINDMRLSELRSAFESQPKFDGRGPVERFLDLIDLPRNVIVRSALDPTGSVAAEALRRGNTGAFGMARVRVSDVLRNLGVSNDIASGSLGLVGDVVFDPLTYVGPAGWGAKLASGGRAASITARGLREIRRAASAVEAGVEVGDKSLRAFLRASGVPEVGSTAEKALEAIHGPLKGGLGSSFGHASFSEDSNLAKALFEIPDPGDANALIRHEAAKDFFARHGLANAPGIRIGRDASGRLAVEASLSPTVGAVPSGTQIFHLPGTSIGISIPPISTAAKESLGVRAIATSSGNVVSPPFRDVAMIARAAYVPLDVAKVADPEAVVDEYRRFADSASSAYDSVRSSALATPEDILVAAKARDSLREAAMKLDADVQRARAAAAGTDMEEVVDAAHESARHAARLAHALDVPLASVMNGEDDALASLAAQVSGLGSVVQGRRILAPLDAVTAAFSGDDATSTQIGWRTRIATAADRGLAQGRSWLRDVFGVRSGDLHRFEKEMAVTATDPLRAASAIDTLTRVEPRIDDIMARHGLAPEMREDVGAALIQLWHNADRHPSELADFDRKAMEALVDGGLLDRRLHPGLADDLADLVKSERARMEQLARSDIAAGHLNNTIENYFPHDVTPEASIAMRRMLSDSPGSGVVADRAAEAFQHERGMVQYRLPDGRTFLRGDRFWMTLTNEELSQLSPESRAYVDDVLATMRDWDALDPQIQAAHPPIQLSPMAVNDLVEHGKLRALLGGRNVDRFLSTNFGMVLAKRYGQSERLRLREMFRDMANRYGLQVPYRAADAIANRADGEIFRLPSGLSGRLQIVNDGPRQRKYLWIGSERFTRPQVAPSDFDVLARLVEPEGYATWYPERIASMIERLNEPVRQRAATFDLLSAMDSMTRSWKVTVLSHLSWVIKDIIGTVYLAAAAGVNPVAMARHFRDALRISAAAARDDYAALASIRTPFGNAVDIINGPARGAVIDAGAGQEAFHHIFDDGKIMPVASIWPIRPGQLRDRARMALEAEAQSSNLLRFPIAQRLYYAKRLLWDEGYVRHIWDPMRRLNAIANNTVRLSTYFSLLESGMSPNAAADFVAEHLLDLSYLTKTENAIRRFVPFYAWSKASAIYGIRQLLENPKFFSIAPHVKHAIETAINGEENLPPYMRPSWLNEQIALQIGADPERRLAVSLLNTLPSEGATRLLAGVTGGMSGVQDAVSWAAGQASPFVRAPFEIGAGLEFFTKRTIAPHERGGDLSVGEYVAQQIRPFRELGVATGRKGAVPEAFSRSTGQGISRIALGGVIQPFDETRRHFLMKRQLGDRARLLTKRIAIARREGRTSEIKAYTGKLYRLYEEMVRAGVQDLVPRRALQALRGFGVQGIGSFQ